MNEQTEVEGGVKEFSLAKGKWIAIFLVSVVILFIQISIDSSKISENESGHRRRTQWIRDTVGPLPKWFGIFLFGTGAAVAAITLLKYREAVVVLTQSGIRDVRWSNVEIPWNAINSIGKSTFNWSRQTSNSIEIVVDELKHPRDQNGLSLFKSESGFYTLSLDVNNLSHADIDEIFSLCEQYLARSRRVQAQRFGAIECSI